MVFFNPLTYTTKQCVGKEEQYGKIIIVRILLHYFNLGLNKCFINTDKDLKNCMKI